MFKTNFFGHKIIWGAQKKLRGTAAEYPQWHIRKFYYMNEIYNKLRQNLHSYLVYVKLKFIGKILTFLAANLK